MMRSSVAALAALAVSGLCAMEAQAQPPMPQQAYAPQYGARVHAPAPTPPGAPGQIRQYPYLNAPLYPCPVQDVPVQMGSTLITNQAFAPHEMLYPHEYRGIYAPYYYRVKGSWLWTPFGIESHDKWELMGTEVKVKYRPSYAPLSGFVAPFHP